MMINVYDSKEINFSHNGLVVLSDCIACKISEELNGSFELELEYPLDERKKWTYLLEGNIIKADGQLFRVYRKIKTLSSIKINARHIYYDLLDNFLEDVRPTNLSGYGALDYILANTQYPHKFTSIGDVGGSGTKYFIRKNPVEATTEIINTWGGELVRDNYTIKLLGARGLDRGVLVSYGKNIQGIEETLDMDSLATRIMPKGIDALLLPEKYIDSQYINSYSHPKIKIVEFDIGEDEENGITKEMAIVLLRNAGNAYMLNSKCDIPQFNYKIDFLELSKTEEYKKYAVLERVYMGDTVTIKHSKLNINLKAKVIKIIKNILTKRIEKIELGSFKPNIATAINNSIQEVKKEIEQVKSDYQKAIDNATDLITGSNGGNVVIRQNENGKPYEILIMNTDNVMTAEKVWRWNLGGFGYSSTGINGPYETAITMDGSIVGKFITALVISGQQITAGIIQSKNGKWQFNLDAENFNLGDKLIFDGDNLIFGGGTTINSAGVFTGTINADNIQGGTISGNMIQGGTISGTNIRTSNTTTYTSVEDANIKLMYQNIPVLTANYGVIIEGQQVIYVPILNFSNGNTINRISMNSLGKLTLNNSPISTLSDLNDYAMKEWVLSQGYTNGYGYATTSDTNALYNIIGILEQRISALENA